MSVIGIIKLGKKLYNKCGYRLASVVSLSVPESAAKMGVNSIKKTTIQHINGTEKFIETWLNKNGKAIKTIHSSTLEPNKKIIAKYKWSPPKTYDENNMLHQYYKRENPYTFENITGYIKKSISVKPEKGIFFEEQKVQHINLDINKKHKTVTKSIGTVDGKFQTSEIYSIQNGKHVKGIELKAEKQQDNLYKTIKTNYFGISEKDAEKILSDEYFHARFLPTFEMAKSCTAQIAKNQGISYIPKLVKSSFKHECIANSGKVIGLSENILNNTTRHSEVVSSLNHEAKHLKQFELVDKYLKGELTNPKEIEMAKKYKYNQDNYIPIFEDEQKYFQQLVEQEAYSEGRKAHNLYSEITTKLKELFKFSSFYSIGA